MPWCPQCKAEYQEGYTECNDCKVTLVDKLEKAIVLEPFLQAEDKKIAEKLVKFFKYSELPCELSYNEEYEVYVVSIPPQYEKDARKLYQAFYSVEQDLLIQSANSKGKVQDNELSEEESEDASISSDSEDTDVVADSETDSDSSEEDEEFVDEFPVEEASDEEEENNNLIYVMKADEYKDLAGTVFIFLLFGIAGVVFVALNLSGILHIFNGWLPNTVMGILFLAFIFIAFTTNKKAVKVRSEIEAENKLTKEIGTWLQTNITKDYLTTIYNEHISEEANHIRNMETIKEMLIKEFNSKNLAYLDRLIDEFYNSTFDNEEE